MSKYENDLYDERYVSIKPGQVFVCTTGDYSDYSIMNIMVAKGMFSMKAQYANCRKELETNEVEAFRMFGSTPPEGMIDMYRDGDTGNWYYTKKVQRLPGSEIFMTWLEKKGLAESLNYKEFHMDGITDYAGYYLREYPTDE